MIVGIGLSDMISLSPGSGAWMSNEAVPVYRHALWRIWDENLPLLLIGALNPSTADHSVNDQTIKRDIAFAKREGYGGIIKVNAFDLRSTDPKALDTHARPASEFNERAWAAAAALCKAALMAYGNGAGERGVAMARAIASTGLPILCLGLTKAGHPRHPVRLGGDTPMVPWAVPMVRE